MNQTQFVRRILKPVAFVACLIPLILIAVDFRGLGANPIEELTHRTGKTTLILLMVTLSVTPIKNLTGVGALITMRRMLGLFAFFYVCLHFLIYLVLDHFFWWEAIRDDILLRPYVTVGFTSFLLLIPLAVTSTKGWIKRMGGKSWNRLHRLVYFAALGGVLHYLWLVKADILLPLIFGGILAVLMLLRFFHRRKRARPASTTAPALES
jgi:sulfoxide reductase heme-binding subunit YedZ